MYISTESIFREWPNKSYKLSSFNIQQSHMVPLFKLGSYTEANRAKNCLGPTFLLLH